MIKERMSASAFVLLICLSGSAVWGQQTDSRSTEPLVMALHDRECVQDCRETLQSCLESAREELAACSEPCSDEREAAREACAADPDGEACQKARAALHECVAPCQEKYRPAVAECFSAARGCVAECPPVDDIACVRRCLAARSQCYIDARHNAQACRERCSDVIALARRACAADPDSQACARATAAARECVAPCGRMLRVDLQLCNQKTRICLAHCETDETPSTDDTAR